MSDVPVWLRDPIGTAKRGENPTVLARTKSGLAVIGATQFLPGYCLLLAVPKFARLEDMPRDHRALFLEEMGLLGEAVSRVCEPLRVNYSIYGNTDAYVHAHVFPRYDWEPAERKPGPVWLYPREMWSDPAHAFDETKHGDLKAKIAAALKDVAKL
ncbi:MAG TPA: hypothetical protein VGG10_18365 [Rhizomicrobium sp.]|jgi:diadenosine tetraphosphate (Ap4A) HIT family hydrolase